MNTNSDIHMLNNENYKINPNDYNSIYPNLLKKRNYFQMISFHNLNYKKEIPMSLFSKQMKNTNSNNEEMKEFENIIIEKISLPQNIKLEIEKYNQDNFLLSGIKNSFCKCDRFFMDYY